MDAIRSEAVRDARLDHWAQRATQNIIERRIRVSRWSLCPTAMCVCDSRRS